MVKRVYLPDLTVEQVLNSRLNYIKYGGRVPRVVQLSGEELNELETPECCPGVDVDEQIKRCAHDFDKNSANRINFFWNTKYRSILLDNIKTSDNKLTLRENLMIPHLSCIEFKRKRTREKNRAYRAKVRSYSEAVITDEESAKKVCMGGHITLSKLAEHSNLNKKKLSEEGTKPHEFRFVYENFSTNPPKYSMLPPPLAPGTASLACYKDMVRKFRPLNMRIYNPKLDKGDEEYSSDSSSPCSPTHSLTHSPSHSPAHSPTHSLPQLPQLPQMPHNPPQELTHSPTRLLTHLNEGNHSDEDTEPNAAHSEIHMPPVTTIPQKHSPPFFSDSETPSFSESSSLSEVCSPQTPKDVLPSSPVSLTGCKPPPITEDIQNILEALESLKQGRC